MRWIGVVRVLAVIVIIGLQQGCAGMIDKEASISREKTVYSEGEADYSVWEKIKSLGKLESWGKAEPAEKTESGKPKNLSRKTALYRQYGEWKGTKYRLGGMSKQGVDCSAFVYLTYRSKFGVTLPRTTTDQLTLGMAIPQKALRPGDLVFFKTGENQKHVGIFVEQRKFLHASSSKGVMLSSLDNNYWTKAYRTARRLE